MTSDLTKDFIKCLKEMYLKHEQTTSGSLDTEQSIVIYALKKLNDQLKVSYDFVKPIGMGGAGLIIGLKDNKIDSGREIDVALKIPRPKSSGLIDSVKNEMIYLNKIRHNNIISLYKLGEIDLSKYDYPLFPFFMMEYIDDAKDLKIYVKKLLKDASSNKDLKVITNNITEIFYKISRAITYLHKNNIIHFDIKPSNILIDLNCRPVLSDLGFAKIKTEDEVDHVVGFTLFYAHPDLKLEYRQMSSKNRVRKPLKPKDFKYSYDIFSFGKSLLEILSLINEKFPDLVVYDYNFVYLHLLACRTLDGKNMRNIEVDDIRNKQLHDNEDISVYKETWMELDVQEFNEIKYTDFKQINEDFEKLLFGEHFLDSIPELNVFYSKRVQISQGIPSPFSERIKMLIEHPQFSRLTFVPQLGLVNLIYPTASHNRFEHSIGVFRNCCLYIQSLYNDPNNPIFKQLININDIKSIMLASLLHDLGQYPLAHEFQELNKNVSHESFTQEALYSNAKNLKGKTIKEIIENEDWGWGVNIENVKNVMKEEGGLFRRNLKHKLLNSIIDGPIDADKIDYLIRDSLNCYLKYGELIDVDRLIRNLTTIITKDDSGNTTFTLGTYEKGQTAAESVTFARYLLYQSLYWHHTARALRSMLRESISPILKQTDIQKYKSFYKELKSLVILDKKTKNICIDDILLLIEKNSDDVGKKMIHMIQDRSIYKRILTIHNENPEEEEKESLIIKFRNLIKESSFQIALQNKIKEAFENFVSGTSYRKVSMLAVENTSLVLDILNTPKAIICDCPEPVYGAKQKLRFIPEPERLHKNYLIRVKTGERVSEVWNKVFFRLMNIASKGRVFCNPEIRDTIMAALSPENIKECVENTIREF
ncbi:MAG: protein kinase [bacterium]|nr:protein kinase [bacterium]